MTIRDYLRAVAQYRLTLVAASRPGTTVDVRVRLRDAGYKLDLATAGILERLELLGDDVGKAIVEGEAIVHDLKRQGLFESATYLQSIVGVVIRVRDTIDDPAPDDEEGRAAA